MSTESVKIIAVAIVSKKQCLCSRHAISVPVKSALSPDKPPVVGFLGAAVSDNTIAIANLCNVLKIPQVTSAVCSTVEVMWKC